MTSAAYSLPLWTDAPMIPRRGIEYRRGELDGGEAIVVVAPSLGVGRTVSVSNGCFSMSDLADAVTEIENALSDKI